MYCCTTNEKRGRVLRTMNNLSKRKSLYINYMQQNISFETTDHLIFESPLIEYS